MRNLTLLFLLLLVAEVMLSGTENRNELFKLGVQQEAILDQYFNLNRCPGGLAVIDFEEDEQGEAVFRFPSFNNVQGSSKEGLTNVAFGKSSTIYSMSQAWLSRMSDFSPPV